jgi:hypothetical protein
MNFILKIKLAHEVVNNFSPFIPNIFSVLLWVSATSAGPISGTGEDYIYVDQDKNLHNPLEILIGDTSFFLQKKEQKSLILLSFHFDKRYHEEVGRKSIFF